METSTLAGDGEPNAITFKPVTVPGDDRAASSTPKGSIFEGEYVSSEETEPSIHVKTWIAVAAMFIFNFTGVLALNGPPTVLSIMGQDLHNTANQTWIANSLSLVQAIICPLLSSISDVFQARKLILVSCAAISFVGCAIAPGASNIYRVIGAQVMAGFGFACIPLALSVPSEILPRRWRPLALAITNTAASLGATVGPLAIGAFTKNNRHTGWRNFYWFQMALWGFAGSCVAIGYQPPKRHTLLDSLSFFQKVGRIDLIGGFLMTAGLTLFLAALNIGGVTFSWSSAQVLTLLVLGIVVSACFGLYEWKGTPTGLLHHDLFRNGPPYRHTLILCLCLILVEGAVLFAYVIFYPAMTTALFETDPLLVAVRLVPFWLGSGVSTMIFGYFSTKFRTIKYPLVVGYVIYTAGMVGFATIQPGDNANAVAFAIISGLGFGGPLILVFSGVQLSIPHSLLATATAVTTSTRSIGATVFTAIYSAIVSSRLEDYIPSYVAKAVVGSGLALSSVGPFIGALTGSDPEAALPGVPGVNQTIIAAGQIALKQAYADGLRDSYILAAAIGAIGVVLCFFVGDLKTTMNYHVDASMEKPNVDHEHVEITST